MAQAQFGWESLPDGLRDINAFLPIIAEVMLARFPSDQGYPHQALTKTDYRVRRGLFGGWDVRVWRQENLIIDVSPGSRFNSALPVLAGLLVLAGLDGLDSIAGASSLKLHPIVTKGVGLVLIAIGTVLFLIIWGGLWLLIRAVHRATQNHRVDLEILEEIGAALPGDAIHTQ